MKIKNILIVKWSFLCLMLCFLSISCNDDEVYDFEGIATNRIYIETNFDQVETFQITHTPIFTSGKVALKIPVSSAETVDETVKVHLSIASSLVSTFNKLKGTNYLPVSKEWIQLEHTTLTIPKGKSISTDSVSVVIPTEKLPQLTAPEGYLLPLTISSVEGGNNAVSKNRNVVYALIESSRDDDNIWDKAIDVEGSTYADRSLWTATQDGQAMSNANKFFDGDESWSSYVSFYSNESVSFTIDFSTTLEHITGIYFSAYIYCDMMLYSSVDGQNWEQLGKPSKYPKIAFYAPITARYIKCELSEPGGGSVRAYIKEFNVYTNN